MAIQPGHFSLDVGLNASKRRDFSAIFGAAFPCDEFFFGLCAARAHGGEHRNRFEQCRFTAGVAADQDETFGRNFTEFEIAISAKLGQAK